MACNSYFLPSNWNSAFAVRFATRPATLPKNGFLPKYGSSRSKPRTHSPLFPCLSGTRTEVMVAPSGNMVTRIPSPLGCSRTWAVSPIVLSGVASLLVRARAAAAGWAVLPVLAEPFPQRRLECAAVRTWCAEGLDSVSSTILISYSQRRRKRCFNRRLRLASVLQAASARKPRAPPTSPSTVTDRRSGGTHYASFSITQP